MRAAQLQVCPACSTACCARLLCPLMPACCVGTPARCPLTPRACAARTPTWWWRRHVTPHAALQAVLRSLHALTLCFAAQYYMILRLGFDGYQKIMQNLMCVAAHLAEGILDTGKPVPCRSSHMSSACLGPQRLPVWPAGASARPARVGSRCSASAAPPWPSRRSQQPCQRRRRGAGREHQRLAAAQASSS